MALSHLRGSPARKNLAEAEKENPEVSPMRQPEANLFGGTRQRRGNMAPKGRVSPVRGRHRSREGTDGMRTVGKDASLSPVVAERVRRFCAHFIDLGPKQRMDAGRFKTRKFQISSSISVAEHAHII